VLGQSGTLRWGLNILHRQGVGAWCHAQIMPPDESSRHPRRPGAEAIAVPVANLPPCRHEIIPIVAQLIASTLQIEVSP